MRREVTIQAVAICLLIHVVGACRADATLPKAIMPDLLHPYKEGRVIWAKAIGPMVKQLLSREK